MNDMSGTEDDVDPNLLGQIMRDKIRAANSPQRDNGNLRLRPSGPTTYQPGATPQVRY